MGSTLNRTGEQRPNVTKGHGTDALGPSDLSDSGSDTVGGYQAIMIDPKTNMRVATVKLQGEPCSGLALGFGSLWVPLCGRIPTLEGGHFGSHPSIAPGGSGVGRTEASDPGHP